MEHSTDVLAERLYQACALAMRVFREQGFVEDAGALEFYVEVRPPATRHRVRASRVLLWLKASGKTPKEESLKAALRSD
jgi:hypothetical protein